LTLFSHFAHLFNENFIDIAFKHHLSPGDLPLDQLHPAIRSLPHSEVTYIKKIVQTILQKSAKTLSLNHALIEETFMQIIGKNCLKKLVDLLVKPNLLYYVICMLIDKQKTRQTFETTDQEPDMNCSESVTNESANQIMSSSLTTSLDANDDEDLLKYENLIVETANRKEARLNHSSSSPDLFVQHNHNISFQINCLNIPNTDKSHEDRTGKEFTLYNIEFEFRINNYLNRPADLADEELVKLKRSRIQRRFKEFVTLQKSIEENGLFRPYIRNIKGPSKFINLSIGNMTEEYVEKRRVKLNKYLNVSR
jgi:hypothetical protein